METAVWVITAILLLAGIAGTVVPGLPGSPLIVIAAVIHKLYLPELLSWYTLVGLTFLALVAVGVDFLFTVAGAKRFGATKVGLVGAALGSMIGLLGSLPGIIIGALLGAAVAELAYAKRPPEEAFKAGIGAALGLVASLAGRMTLAVMMAALFLLDCFLY